MEIAENMKNFEGENNIEFTQNSKTATVYFSQGRYISKIKKLKEQFPDEVDIVVENYDGSIVAHIPTKWIKINNPQRNMTEEQKEEAANRMREIVKSQKKGKKK